MYYSRNHFKCKHIINGHKCKHKCSFFMCINEHMNIYACTNHDIYNFHFFYVYMTMTRKKTAHWDRDGRREGGQEGRYWLWQAQ